MSERQFIVTDIDYEPLAKEEDGEQGIFSNSIVKAEEEVKNEEAMLFSQDDLSTQSGGFQIIEDYTGAGNQENPTTFAFTDGQMNQILNGGSFAKLPQGFQSTFKMEDFKGDRSLSHYIKYRIQDGKHMKVWECGICSKEFGHQYTLMRHLPTHTDERKFQCNTCGKAFRQMSTLSQHRAIHSAERPYICEMCQKTFNRVSTLISHRKTHTGQKPHQCHLCSKAFHQKGNLRNHIFTHTNARPYKCDICSKGFNQMSNLMCHKLKAHQRNDKPKYMCQICGRDFQKRMGLRNHEQYHHGVQNNDNGTTLGQTRIKYTNGVLVDPITTAAMQHALATNQTPFALLRPLNGIPVLVRVLAAGEKQMLVPATAEDLKKHGHISITPKTTTEDDEGNGKDPLQEQQNGENGKTIEVKSVGSTVQIKIPVVATVVQCCGKDGNVCMAVQSPGPSTESTSQDGYIFTTTNTENEGENCNVVGNEEVIEHEVAQTITIDNNNILANEIQFLDDKGNILTEQDLNGTNRFYQQNFPFASDQEVFNQNVQLENNILHLEDNQENIPPNIFKEIDTDSILNMDNSNMQIYKILDTPQDITIDKTDTILDPTSVLYDSSNLNSDYLLQ